MDTFEKLEDRINKAVRMIERLGAENKKLGEEREKLRARVTEAESKLKSLGKVEKRKIERARAKLGAVMAKLDALEKGK